MSLATISSVRDVIEVTISAVSVLGGFMAFESGRAASLSMRAGRDPAIVAHRLNEGIADGFDRGLPFAFIAFILLG